MTNTLQNQIPIEFVVNTANSVRSRLLATHVNGALSSCGIRRYFGHPTGKYIVNLCQIYNDYENNSSSFCHI